MKLNRINGMAADSLVLTHLHSCCKKQKHLLIKRIKFKILKNYPCQTPLSAGGTGQSSIGVVVGGEDGPG
jgi:hypothetical protein